eukprot:1157303-Pelagomonas_calceolata.AAC.6
MKSSALQDVAQSICTCGSRRLISHSYEELAVSPCLFFLPRAPFWKLSCAARRQPRTSRAPCLDEMPSTRNTIQESFQT